MADYPISNVPRRIVYANSGVGPYAFTFEILNQTDIAVYRGATLLTITTDYSVTINTNGTGSVTLVTAGTGNITIVGAKNIQRTTDFTTGGDLFANTLNDELDNLTIFTQQVAETAERGLKAPVTDPTDINMTLPSRASRAGKTLAFDGNGNPVVGEDIGNWRDEWASGVSYSARDLVKDPVDGSIYRAKETHVSTGSAPIETNVDAAKWDLIIDGTIVADAEAARDAALAAQAAAETAETNAETAETNAETAATAAASSASAASTSATNASNSATAAATSASNASTSATNAASSATSASNSATTATTQATNASNSATAAATSASNAASSATAAAGSASSAGTSATNAASSATLANDWATKTSGPVAGGEYSAKYHAQAAGTSATNAANSASSASTSATNAATSATNAANSATSASNSATTATTQATNASNSATAAATSASNASTSATNAANSASAAATSATNAANSASAASTSATNASNSASSASTSATNAASSATAAQSAQSAAESARDATLAAYDSFDDRYLGTKTSNPTLDNDGNALVAGSLYFNSVAGEMRVYTGTAWVAAYVSGSGFLASANNLSDLTNTATARTNLGLAIGTNVQAYDADLATIAGLTPTNNYAIIGNGTTWTSAALPTPASSLDDLTDVTITSPANNQVLRYNGTAWVNGAASGGGQFFGTAAVKAIAYNSQTIAENLTVTTGNSGYSAGPITVSAGYSVTVQAGSRWVII